jgi:crotonobetainyl-CoA:carnitine CoA-transferase CaiB-like acyl-CoA transferase
VRVLDLTHVLNGPFATMLLAHMGADVVKIEHGDGDMFRRSWMAPDADHDGYESLVVNANKRCITLNLKEPEGKAIFEQLVALSDVVAENFSVGTMDRLGLGYEHLAEINPRIVYARSTGYGSTGPYSVGVPAFAYLIMALTGWVHSGWANTDFVAEGTKSIGIGDEAAGVSMALGICAALYARERSGEGQCLEVSMQEAQLGFMVSSLHTWFEGQAVGGPPSPCADGYVIFHVPDLSQEQWAQFCRAMGHPEGVDAPHFATREQRRANYADLEVLVGTWVATKTRAELWQIFRDAKVPGAPVLSIGEALEDEHLNAVNGLVDVEDARAGTLRMLRPWIRFSESETDIRHAGPAIGQHNYEVYGELLGMSAETVDDLAARAVI